MKEALEELQRSLLPGLLAAGIEDNSIKFFRFLAKRLPPVKLLAGWA